MAKKHWIYIKRGLSEDAKHRAQMGECIWLYMHVIDRADWETGIVYDWKDEQEAADMGMPVRTLREQRRKLDELDYISCTQRQYGQDIVIKRWIDPRNYSGDVLNQGDVSLPPQENEQGDTQGDTQGSSQDVTPTFNSKKKSIDEVIESANKKMDAYLQLSQSPGIKRMARIDSILSYVAVSLKINTETKRWKEFAKFVDDRQQSFNESVEVFVNWLKNQKNFDIQYWSPSRMMEMWPQAFAIELDEEKIRLL